MAQGAHLSPIIRGAAVVMAIRIIGAGLVYASHVFLARWLGSFEFGIYAYVWVCVTILSSLATLGLTSAVVRFIPEYVTKKRWGRVAGIVRQSRLVTFSTAIVISGIGSCFIAVGAEFIAPYYLIPLYIGMACVPLFALILLYTELARGFGWLALAYLPQFIGRPVFLIIGVGIILRVNQTTDGATAMGVAMLYCFTTVLLQALFFSNRIPRAIRQARPVYHTRYWARITFPLLLMQGFELFLYNTDMIMLGGFVDPDDIAVYTAAARTAGLICFVLYAVVAVAAPKYSALHAANKQTELRALVVAVVRWIFWPSLLFGIGLVIVGEPVLALFGPTFTSGYPVLVVLIIGNLVVASTGSSAPLLNVTGYQSTCASVFGSTVILNIVLNLVLIPQYGLMGAAIATATSMGVTSLGLTIVVRRRFGFYSFIFANAQVPKVMT